MTKEIRPLQRYNENTGQTEIFYPGTTTDAIAHPTKRKSLTNVISDIEDAYAKQTGYYETLGAGTATNLRGVNPTEGTFTFRPTGGNADVANGTAYLERIKGNTVKWNQLLRANKLVDMGLPSGTLWATCDIDVTKADKFCETPFTYEKSFFSWGNVEGHNPISNNAFDYNWGSVNSQEPYYEGQPYGETQGNTLTSRIPANATYDAARSHLGASWRMPTGVEFNELFANTKFINADGTEIDASVTDKRVTVNGIRGIYLESNINGARLFFSCSGSAYNRTWDSRGVNGNYWSSAFSSARNAQCMRFNSGSVYPHGDTGRFGGVPIRPVTNSAIVTDENGHKYAVNGKYIIDLTLMYGEGNEPSTIAQFEADYFKWFGKPLTYEDYTKGELRDVKMSAIKTTGFNAWDGLYTSNKLLRENGIEESNASYVITGYIPIIPNTQYYINKASGTSVYLCFYNDNKVFISGIKHNNAGALTFITPSNARYIRDSVNVDNINSYCINLSHSGKRDGEHEPHWEETKNVPITTLTGKLNGEGESIIVFPDGMKSAGEVHDDILIENGKAYAIKRIGSVDMGSLAWKLSTSYADPIFQVTISSLTTRNCYLICAKYEFIGAKTISSFGNDTDTNKRIAHRFNNAQILAKDLDYATAEDFKAAMNGVSLYYELETPLVYELDNFQLPLPYRVDDYGTEEIKGAENSVAPTLNIRYGINAGDTITNLPKNYISAESIDQLLATMSSAMGGTWTKTWDAANGRYTFSFTQAATLNLAPTEPEPEEES